MTDTVKDGGPAARITPNEFAANPGRITQEELFDLFGERGIPMPIAALLSDQSVNLGSVFNMRMVIAVIAKSLALARRAAIEECIAVVVGRFDCEDFDLIRCAREAREMK